jgi:hypothetical protein
MGWPGFFLFCAVLAIPGMLLIPLLEASARVSGWRDWVRRGVITATVLAGAYTLVASAGDILGLFFKA